MTINISQASFKSTGSTTTRTLGARAAHVVNVKDYGAVGDGVADDKAAIQSAIDAAFGTAGSPNGYTNRASNKALYFPSTSGGYRITDSLVFTHVYGGLIYSEQADISLTGSGASTTNACFVVNGMVETKITNLSLFSASGSPCNLDLDWDGDWNDLPVADTNGLNHNVIANGTYGTADMGIRVAQSGFDGAHNTFLKITVLSTQTCGIELKGADAVGNMVIGGGVSATNKTGYKMTAGQFSVIQGVSNANNSPDFAINSDFPVAILGGRAETAGTCLDMSTGLVCMKGFLNVNGGVIANITGGKCILDSVKTIAGTTITGSGGTLYIRGCQLPAGVHSTYTGTVAQEI